MTWVMVALLCAPGAAHAQDGRVDLQLFEPTLAAGTTFTVDRPEVPRHLGVELGLGLNGAVGLLERSDGQDVQPWRVQADLFFAVGLFQWIEFGIGVPVVFSQAGELSTDLSRPIETSSAIGIGDIRMGLKMPIVRGLTALSARIDITLPTGSSDAFATSGRWTLRPGLVFAHRTGGFSLGVELGYHFRDYFRIAGFEYDDELRFKLGAAYAFSDTISVMAEANTRMGIAGVARRNNEFPVEVDAGVRLQPSSALGRRLLLDIGVGTGVIDGYGAPVFRGFVVVRYRSEREPCEAGPEDFDGFDDGDFCADLDNDQDGIEDSVDVCPNDPEDDDGFESEDGCPDPDNDADGVLDGADECPLDSEDADGYQDADGCPEVDNDEDGIPDGVDACRMEPEDRDGFQDEDGCPEPGPERAVVTVTDTRILISERIYFDFDTDEIRSVSLPLLDQVAEVINDLPRRRRIRVEGYTDDMGEDEYNRDLSYRRARAVVEYLRARGVDRDRLTYEGYGEQNPVAPNDSPEGRALNRRVEFTIMPD